MLTAGLRFLRTFSGVICGCCGFGGAGLGVVVAAEAEAAEAAAFSGSLDVLVGLFLVLVLLLLEMRLVEAAARSAGTLFEPTMDSSEGKKVLQLSIASAKSQKCRPHPPPWTRWCTPMPRWPPPGGTCPRRPSACPSPPSGPRRPPAGRRPFFKKTQIIVNNSETLIV